MPIAEVEARASEVVRRVRKNGRQVVITQSGKPAAVLVSPEEIDERRYCGRFVAAVEEGLAEVQGGRGCHDAVDRVNGEQIGKHGR